MDINRNLLPRAKTVCIIEQFRSDLPSAAAQFTTQGWGGAFEESAGLAVAGLGVGVAAPD